MEIQLRAAKLNAKFRTDHVTRLRIDECYRVFRETLMRFHQASAPSLGSKDAALFFAQSQGIDVISLLAPSMSKKSIARFRKKYAGYTFDHVDIDFAKLLPAKFPPKVVEPGMKRIRIRLI